MSDYNFDSGSFVDKHFEKEDERIEALTLNVLGKREMPLHELTRETGLLSSLVPILTRLEEQKKITSRWNVEEGVTPRFRLYKRTNP